MPDAHPLGLLASLTRRTFGVIGVLLGFSLSLPAADADADRVAALIKQLGADAFIDREKAGRDLALCGEKAWAAVNKAASDNPDLEIRRRAREVARAILRNAGKSQSLGIQLAVIDPGEFSMGTPRNEGRVAGEEPHDVRLTKPYLLGVHEVTQEDYQKVMKANPSWFRREGGGKEKVKGLDTERFPVESVSWFDALEFCNRLSKQDGFEPYYKLDEVKREKDSIRAARVTIGGGNGYRLPTEAEWEYGCRAGTITTYHHGYGITEELANIKPSAGTGGYGGGAPRPSLGRTAKVGSYKPNAWGLYDMHGNVAEWVFDWYDKDYYGRSPKDDPPGPDKGVHRVVRGGSWLVNESRTRSASRFWHTPDETKDFNGFRLCRSPQ